MAADFAGSDSLFETTRKKRWLVYRIFAGSLMAGICLIWVYRVAYIPASGGARWAWLGLLAADIWFGLYWVLTQSVRWSPISRKTFKHRLSQRYDEDELPKVDVFVCTADPTIEPPALVVNTVLSVMAYQYPPQKLSVYLSDDGGSDLTFYALLEAARFARVWIPFCHKFHIEPRSPAAFFLGAAADEEHRAVLKLYEEMEERIRGVTQKGRVPEEIRTEHKGFSEWLPGMSSRDHPSIVQILIDGRDPAATDAEGCRLPTLVYVAREKRPQYHHNFKAGAMNCLLRVSSEISGGRIILNVDCDMYSSDSQSVRDALCCFMDERKGDEIAFVQFSQKFANLSKNDLYANSLTIINEVDFHGLDGVGGPLYTGSGCFHRRRSLMGEKYEKSSKEDWKTENRTSIEERSTMNLENRAKSLVGCSFEYNTQWGKEVGLKYGCPVEDVMTGLAIQCRGWKSVYLNPKPGAFFGLAPATLSQTLLQHKRWSEGDFQILFSPSSLDLYSPCSSTHVLHRIAYSIYFLWAPNSIPTFYYTLIPSLSLLARFPLFPKLLSPWFLPFAYVAVSAVGYGLWESLDSGMTTRGWCNERRMWLYKRTTSYLFGFVDTLIQKLGFRSYSFAVTPKISDEGLAARFQREEMEFGASSPASLDFIVLGSIAMINLLCLAAVLHKMVKREMHHFLGDFFFQILICGLLVAINLPVYGAMFFRKDTGRMPTVVTEISMVVAAATMYLWAYATDVKSSG